MEGNLAAKEKYSNFEAEVLKRLKNKWWWQTN